MKLNKIGEVWNSANRFLSDFMGLLSSKNFATMTTWLKSLRFTEAHLIRTPRYYGQFSLSRGKISPHIFSNSTRLIPIFAGFDRTVSVKEVSLSEEPPRIGHYRECPLTPSPPPTLPGQNFQLYKKLWIRQNGRPRDHLWQQKDH